MPASLKQALCHAGSLLEARSDSPELDARVLLQYCLQRNQAWLLAPAADAQSSEDGRWHTIGSSKHVSIRVDLNSLEKNGDVVTYRSEWRQTIPNTQETFTRYGISQMDCVAEQRRLIATVGVDGIRVDQKRPWHDITDRPIENHIRQIVCGEADGNSKL